MASPHDQDLQIVRLAAAHYRYEANRLQVARDRFGLSGTQFYQRLNQLIEQPEIAIAEPVLVARLRRQRDRLQRIRKAG
jgi:hypothetical protein